MSLLDIVGDHDDAALASTTGLPSAGGCRMIVLFDLELLDELGRLDSVCVSPHIKLCCITFTASLRVRDHVIARRCRIVHGDAHRHHR